jgi:Baseplate J-like protein
MTMDYGVTENGFVVKGFDVLLADSIARAQAMFGSDVDLTSTSPLRKLIEVTAAEDGELWKSMEDLYYSSFASSAVGDALDLVGGDVGVPRRAGISAGSVRFTLTDAVPGRSYTIPEATVVVTADSPPVAFATGSALVLDATTTTGDVGVQAYLRGPSGDVAAGAVIGVDPAFAEVYLGDFAPATLAVTNQAAFAGGTTPEDDDDYRGRLVGISRDLWTVQSVTQAVLGVEGVLDVMISDPLGGVDVSQSYFGVFTFGTRLFSEERGLGEPYFVDAVVAHTYAWPWRTTGVVPGVADQVQAAVDLVRPIGVHVNVVEADHIDVGVRARVTVAPGQDVDALAAAIRARLAQDIGGLRLGADVLFSQVMAALVEQVGVVDVQQLHLRRSPPAFGRITFGNVLQQSVTIEAAVGDNLTMGPTELAVFQPDTDLVDLDLVPQ